MPNSTNLQFPYLSAAQAQKHVTVNETLRLLDALVKTRVVEQGLTAPPGSPADGSLYIPGSGASGAWDAWDFNLAYYVDGAWQKIVPKVGWLVYDIDQDAYYKYEGAPGYWTEFTGGGGGGATRDANATARVVATGSEDPATDFEDGDTVDGVTLAEGDLVLRASATDPEKNGVYEASASGAASRHEDFDAYDDHPGALVAVQEGTANADTLWLCTSDTGGTLDTTAIVFDEFEGSAPVGGLRDYFIAHKNAAQNAISLNTLVQLEYSAEEVDSGGNCDAANSKWVPAAGPVAIFLGANVVFSTGGRARLHIVKNGNSGPGDDGVRFPQIAEVSAATAINPAGPYFDVADGDDEYEFYVYVDVESTQANVGADPRGSWVMGMEL